MKVILSQGQGKLQLHQTAGYLKKAGINVKYISGWIPKKYPKVVNFIGNLVGKPDLYRKLKLRQPENLNDEDVITCIIPEAWYWFLIIMVRMKLVTLDEALARGWLYWGSYSKRHIKNADLFHVRSGGGQGGAINKAKSENMAVVVDHSIAHPTSMRNLLIEEYNRFGIAYDLEPTSKFWSLVIKDCNDADYIIVNSDFVKETFLENNYPENKIKVIYLGVRDDFIGIKTDWQLSDTAPLRLVFIGAFGFRKGARILIEAMKILADRNENIVLDVIGNIDGMSEILDQYKLTNINFHGTFLYDDLKQFLKGSDLFVFPTFAEGSARAAMEAMAAGLPVITTAYCGIPITHNQTGVIIPVNDPQSLVDEILRLAIDHDLRKKIGCNAIDLIRSQYTWDIYTKNLISIYNDIIN
jgi:glycosyltransferase involved in cell wall biosynthesis